MVKRKRNVSQNHQVHTMDFFTLRALEFSYHVKGLAQIQLQLFGGPSIFYILQSMEPWAAAKKALS